MPELGLPEKSYGYVDSAADWYAPTEEHPYNTVEYHETLVPGEPEHFIGFTEDLGGYGDTHRFPRRDGCRRRAIARAASGTRSARDRGRRRFRRVSRRILPRSRRHGTRNLRATAEELARLVCRKLRRS
jgi:hypothetical protein